MTTNPTSDLVVLAEKLARFGPPFGTSAATLIREAIDEITRLTRLTRELAEEREACARIFVERAHVHAAQATWIGPQRQRYEGARIPGVEMSPMNGPAIAYDREMANALSIRSLKQSEDRAGGK